MEPAACRSRLQAMAKDTGPRARKGMMSFVITIFLAAIVLAAIYMIGFTPGETN